MKTAISRFLKKEITVLPGLIKASVGRAIVSASLLVTLVLSGLFLGGEGMTVQEIHAVTDASTFIALILLIFPIVAPHEYSKQPAKISEE